MTSAEQYGFIPAEDILLLSEILNAGSVCWKSTKELSQVQLSYGVLFVTQHFHHRITERKTIVVIALNTSQETNLLMFFSSKTRT